MNNLTRFRIVGMLLLSFLPSVAQQQPTIVTLAVIHNGHKRPAPTEITVSFDGHSLQIPLREGKFEAPPELVAAQHVTLETDAEGDHIRTHIAGADFTEETWTLRLAERANDDYYDWPGPKGADIRASCMLEFESIHSDPGRVHFEQHCRNKNK